MNKREKLEKAAKDIQAQIDALPKNELGWYKDLNDKVFCVTEFLGNNWTKVYGFGDNGDWMTDNAQTLMDDSYTPLTKAEHKTLLEPALIAEAKKRGFEKDCFFESAKFGVLIEAFGILEYWNPGNVNGLHFTHSQGLILNNGVWAKVIKSKVIINGLEMKQDRYNILFGSMEFKKLSVRALYANCKELGVSSVNIDGHTMVTLEQLKQIVDAIRD